MYHYFFGDYCLQEDRRRLLRGDEEIHLKRKEFLVLELLLQDAPLPVDHAKFGGRIWKKANINDLPRSLAQTVYLLRKALGDTGPEYRFIRNRSGWSYEFASPVQRRLPTDPPPNTEFVPSSEPPPASPRATDDAQEYASGPAHDRTDDRRAYDARTSHSRPLSAIPPAFTLRSRVGNPRLADFRDLQLPRPPWTLNCRIRSDAPYFRFGFKFLTDSGRLFGDTTIESRDANLVVHVGRNNWSREGISSRDLFLAAYRDGARLDLDRRVLRVSRRTPVALRLSLNRDHGLEMQVEGSVCFLHFIHPSIGGRVLILAWGDHDDCQVEVTQLAIQKSPVRRP